MSIWVFGYGSLIWRPDFEFLESRPARLGGWQRRFWQGSHDHRGLPQRPGRVVTLVPAPGQSCDGMAYLVDDAVADRTFAALDHREKNGYERHRVLLDLSDSSGSADPAKARPLSRQTPGVVYIAARDNHAYLGPAPTCEIARQIVGSRGPSGHNLDYLLELAAALRDRGWHDDHVFELEAAALVLARTGSG